MTEPDIELLLSHGEDTRIEYKQTLNFTDKSVRAELALDILAMANAHEATPGYILIGVEEGPPRVLHDASGLLLDDGTIHAAVEPYMEPPVDFSFRYVPYQGVLLGLIVVPPSKHRFHITKKDFTQNGRYLVTSGDIWIRSGAQRRKASGFDMQRLRDDWLRNEAAPQPLLEVTFADGQKCLPLNAIWKQPMLPIRFGLGVARFVRGMAIQHSFFRLFVPNPENIPMPVGIQSLRFFVHNHGSGIAEKITIEIKIPDDCGLWAGAYQLNPEPKISDEWHTKYSIRRKRISISGIALVHGLEHRSDVVCIRFPSPERTYEFHWTARAGNMIKPCYGSLRAGVGL